MNPTLDQAVDYRLQTISDVLRSGAGESAGRAIREASREDDPYAKVSGRIRGYRNAFPELEDVSAPRQEIVKAIQTKRGVVYGRLVRAVTRQMEREGFVPRKKRSPGPLVVPPHAGNVCCKHCRELHAKGQHSAHGAGSFHRTHMFSFGKENPQGWGKETEKLPAKNGRKQERCLYCGNEYTPYEMSFHLDWHHKRGDALMKNPKGYGKAFTFHGSFTSKLLAVKRERSIPGSFIEAKNGRYYVLKPKRVKNPQSKRLVRIYGRVLKIEAQKTGAHRNCDAECKRCQHKYVHDFRPGAVMYGLPDGSILIKKG